NPIERRTDHAAIAVTANGVTRRASVMVDQRRAAPRVADQRVAVRPFAATERNEQQRRDERALHCRLLRYASKACSFAESRLLTGMPAPGLSASASTTHPAR